MSIEKVLNHHLGAFGTGDLDEVMNDYTNESVLIVPEVTIKGRSAIRSAFESFFNGLFKPGTYEFSLDRIDIVGDIAYIVWHSENEGADVSLGTDTFLIRDGNIAIQTFAAKVDEK